MPLRALTCILALALALGALVVGQVLIMPMISAGGALADANLAHALSRPISLRLAEFACAAALGLWLACAQGWPRGALSTLSAAALAICVVDRALLLPSAHESAQLVDLVTLAPATHAASFARAELVHQLAVASSCVLLCATAVVLARRLNQARVRALAESHAQHSARQPGTAQPTRPGLQAGLAQA